MPSNFKIGISHADMQTLDARGLPETPHPVMFKPYSQTYADGDGKPRGDGTATAEWHFDLLTHSQLQYFMGILAGAQGCEVSIVTRTDYGASYSAQFVEFEGYLERPTFGDQYEVEMGRQYYTDVTLRFTFLQEYTE